MKGIAVIGANYGDEGKGLMTDFLCAREAKAGKQVFVVRHNGGAQAGHTVVAPASEGGFRHVFHHFGSGTLQSIPTILAKDFILNPILFRKEYEELEAAGYAPEVFVDVRCRITTPWDMVYNQAQEEARSPAVAGGERHGSCGVGINATVDRNEVIPFTRESGCLSSLERISGHYKNKMFPAGVPSETENSRFFMSPGLEEVGHAFSSDLYFLIRHTSVMDYPLCQHPNADSFTFIFEGAQGLGLDEYMGSYPHVTRSNTGLRNVVDFCREHKIDLDEIVYVTRSYLTRHGNGPMEGTLYSEEAYFEDKTNVPNPWQGTLRQSAMDEEAYFNMAERVAWDTQSVGMGSKPISLAITHNDQLTSEDWEYSLIPVKYKSFGETREDVKETKK